jgi:predicted TIM-barrel fold metal-dependent hydrolase
LGAFYDFPVEGEGTYAHLERTAQAVGYSGFLLFCVATNAHQVPRVNDSIASLMQTARSHGLETVGLAGMHQDFPDFEGELNRSITLGLQGVKIHPDIQGIDADAPVWFPLYEMMQDKDMLLYLHAGDDRPQYRFSEPGKIAHIAKCFPRLRIVAAHLGGYRAWGEAKQLYALDNIFYDCSSALWAMDAETAVSVIRNCGSDKVMYGSDYPVINPETHLRLFLTLPLSEKEREDILYNNAKKILGF